jgi:type VI secretion system protein ImpM
MAALTFSQLGLFGKIPAQGDFLRAGAQGAIVQAFDRWLEESLDGLRRAGGGLPDEPLCFLYRGSGVREALIGAMLPSVDAVGREFPLAVYGVADGAELAEAFPLAPTACAHFLAAAGDLLREARGKTGAQLAAELAHLPRPAAEDTQAALGTQRAVLSHGRSGDLVARLFTGPAGQAFYAFRTFAMACEPLRGQVAQRSGVTLDCPVRAAVDRVAWLELARRLLAWRDGPPTLLWVDAPAPRLLVSLGPAPAALLTYLARPDHGGARLWPLVTDRPAAIDEAHRALPATPRAALERPDTSLEALLASLAG